MSEKQDWKNELNELMQQKGTVVLKTLVFMDDKQSYTLIIDSIKIKSFIEKTLAEERGEIVEIISKYNGMEEIIENGQRYLIDGEGNKIALGYPYLESKQQYIVRDILSLIHWNTNPNPNSTLLN